MFYVKARGRKINLSEDNIFTRCPECGREHAVDLVSIFEGGKSDFYSTYVHCQDCSEKRLKNER